ncbi:glycosyltransferase [Candidatus Peregrinibacteria bacterium]|nr:glycosyltransferase [Candidatus Peregrinibacteria bacterium]
MPKNKFKASIVILDFLKSKRVCENVDSIKKQKVDFPYEIIIVDNSCNTQNAEKLNTLKHYEDLQIHINKKNLGYIGGNNQGASFASGEYLLIVNPDIIWADRDCLEKLVKFMDKNPKVGICGPKQINDSDNSVAMTVRAFPNMFVQVARRTFLRYLPIIRKWVAYDEMRHLDYNKVQTVDWLQSSFWIIRKDFWDKLGGLDKDYFIFMSDPDLCFKCWREGYQVVYNPEITVHADGRRASEGGFLAFFNKWTLRQHVKDAFVYQLKHLFKANPHLKSKR